MKTFSKYIGGDQYFDRSYFAVMLVEKGEACYAIAFGKGHFSVRPYCDYDFGIELAKRIADEDDIVQTATRRYQGKQKQDIRSSAGQAPAEHPAGQLCRFPTRKGDRR